MSDDVYIRLPNLGELLEDRVIPMPGLAAGDVMLITRWRGKHEGFVDWIRSGALVVVSGLGQEPQE